MSKTLKLMVAFAILFAVSGIAFAQNTGGLQSTFTAGYTFNVAYNSTVGNYLVNSQGYTLYVFSNDKPYSGTSSCYGGCASLWFSYYNSNAISVPASLNISDFGTINRTGGGKQFTYLGQPLYTYIYDTAPGQTNGNGFENLWHVATIQNYVATASSNTRSSNTTQSSNATTAKSVVTNSTAATSTATSNNTANTSSSASSYPATSTTSISAANSTAKPKVQAQNSGSSGIYAAVIVIIIIIIIGVYLYTKRK